MKAVKHYKALAWDFSRHCENSRRPVDCFSTDAVTANDQYHCLRCLKFVGESEGEQKRSLDNSPALNYCVDVSGGCGCVGCGVSAGVVHFLDWCEHIGANVIGLQQPRHNSPTAALFLVELSTNLCEISHCSERSKDHNREVASRIFANHTTFWLLSLRTRVQIPCLLTMFSRCYQQGEEACSGIVKLREGSLKALIFIVDTSTVKPQKKFVVLFCKTQILFLLTF